MQFTGMTGNGMRIQTSDNSDIKFSAGTGDIIFDYANSGGKVISFADISGSATTTGSFGTIMNPVSNPVHLEFTAGQANFHNKHKPFSKPSMSHPSSILINIAAVATKCTVIR